MSAQKLQQGAWEGWAVVAITLLAAGLRFYRLDQFPPGLHYDEAFNGFSARTMLEGGPLRIFFPGDMGEEPFHIYVVTAALGLLGYAPWVIRLVSALIGTLTVPLVWWLGREICAAGEALWTEKSRKRVPSLEDSSRSTRHSSGKVWRRMDSRPRSGPCLRGDGQALRGNDGEKWELCSSGCTERYRSSEETGRTFVGLGTALVLAILYWHLSVSRVGMEMITVPLFASLAVAPLLRGLRTGRWPAFALAGVGIGGSLYTYKAGYMVPILAVLVVGYRLVTQRRLLRSRPHVRGLALATLVAVAIAAPIVLYFVAHPYDFWHRPGDVVSTGSGESLAWSNLPKVLGMFFVRGDSDPRNNLPGRPALDPFLALLFLAGTGRAVVDAARGRLGAATALLWLIVMSVPTLITVEAPHFRRGVGLPPILAVLCALGGWMLWQLAGRLWASARSLEARGVGGARPRAVRAPRLAAALLLAAGLVFSAGSTVRAYFVTWGRGPDVFFAYDVGLVEVARYLNGVPLAEEVYITPTHHEHYTLQFLARRPYATFDGREGSVFPPPARPATVVVMLQEDRDTLPELKRARPDGRIVWRLADPWGRPFAAAYRLPASPDPAPDPPRPAGVTFGGSIRLLGYALDSDAIRPGTPVTVTLYWQALAPISEDYTVFTHLLGLHNPATDGPVWAGDDSQPAGTSYPTTRWQPGEVILDVHRLALPADAPPGDYQIEAGLYLLATLERLSAAGPTGAALPDDAAILGSLEVGSRRPGGEAVSLALRLPGRLARGLGAPAMGAYRQEGAIDAPRIPLTHP